MAVDAAWSGAAGYPDPHSRVIADWSGAVHLAPAGLPAPAASAPSLSWTQAIEPVGADSAVFGDPLYVHHPDAYLPPHWAIDAQAAGRLEYAGALALLPASWAHSHVATLALRAYLPIWQGFTHSALPVNTAGHANVTLTDGVKTTVEVLERVYRSYLADGENARSPLNIGWQSPILLADGTETVLKPDPFMVKMTALYTPRSIGETQYIAGIGFESGGGLGVQLIRNNARLLRPSGFVATAFGLHHPYNLHQYVRPSALASQAFGVGFLWGGVKFVTPGGIAIPGIGRPSLVNTTANQEVRPSGIGVFAVPSPNVSPRILRPAGILGLAIGFPRVNPNPSPVGFFAGAHGVPTIAYRELRVDVPGMALEGYGYPVVFDPTQTVSPASLLQAGVFGDIAVRNVAQAMQVQGFASLEMSAWATLRNSRRFITVPGMAPAPVGTPVGGNANPTIAPAGFDSLVIQPPGLGYSVRFIFPAGLVGGGVGAPSLEKTPQLWPVGIAPRPLGQTTIWPRVRTLEVHGHDSQRFGTVNAWFRYRFIRLTGWDSGRYGAGKAEHGNRYLIAAGSDMLRTGTPAISFAERFITPAGIFQNFATGHMVGGLRYLQPVGFDAARFGARIIPEIQQVYPQGFSGLYGEPYLRNATHIITPPGFLTVGQQPADRWGTLRAFNLRQYVEQFFDGDSGLAPPAWPQWTLIENRNRYARPAGDNFARIGTAQIDNKARPVYPLGAAAPDPLPFYRAGLVAYRIRSLHLDGIEAPYLSSWAAVFNDAFVARPDGMDMQQFGSAALENTRRFYPRVGNFDSAVLGYPMVAPRIRSIEFEPRYTIGPPAMTPQGVKLHTRYVDGVGQDLSGIGSPSLVIHWTRITPRWTLQNLVGTETVVRNLTPEVRTHGANAELFGDAFVRLEWRPVEPYGALTQLIGRATIADRDRTIPVQGIRAWAFGDKLTVIRTGAPPYSTQFVSLDEVFNAGQGTGISFGIAPPAEQYSSQLGQPTMNQQVLYVVQDSPHTRYGSARVIANSIRVEPGLQELLVGDPAVGLKVRTVTVAEFQDAQVFQPSRCRLSPHTIYAVMEAPQQAKDNHLSNNLHYVDGFSRDPGAIFGRPSITNQHRFIAQLNWVQTVYGRPTLQLKRHYIIPQGFTSYRGGWHVIPGTQMVEQFDSASTAAVGSPGVSRPPYVGPQTIGGHGLVATVFGRAQVDLFNREVRPAGYLATLMGSRRNGDSPYMWQGLRVGPLMPTIPAGFAAEQHGLPWVSFRVRGVSMQGFDAFLSEYQLEAFEQRMRVARRAVARPSRVVGVQGFAAAAFGVAGLRPAAHYIRPDGNADQYRKGAPSNG